MGGGGGGYGKIIKVTKALKYLVNMNEIFEYNTQLVALDAPSVAKIFSHNHW